MKLEAGHVLSGTLRLVQKIGDGGMASVWLAEHLLLGTNVAVKVISGPFADVSGAQSRFVREARMTARIDSPHVVRVLDCRLTNGDEPYLVLELLRGENLEQRVRRRGPLSLADTVEVIAQAGEALAASHRAGIVHRDLKPENIFLVRGPNIFVKLLDFGVAKPLRDGEHLACDREPAGTPQYMGPEHIFAPDQIDERSDLFSLAAVGYFALTRRAPFEGESLQAVFLAIDGGYVRPATALRPDLPSSIDRWFSRALAQAPADRFPDGRAMVDALYDAARAARPGAITVRPPLASSSQLEEGETFSALAATEPRGGRRNVVFATALAMVAGAGVFTVHRSGQDAVSAAPARVAEAARDLRAEIAPRLRSVSPVSPPQHRTDACVEPELSSAEAVEEPASDPLGP